MPRRYLVVRTDKNNKEFVLRELVAGRLRQGWGYDPTQDLRSIAAKLAARADLTEAEAVAWRNRRLLDTQPDGVQPGDVVVIPNLPDQGSWVMCRIAGGYHFEISKQTNAYGGFDYGHIVEVEPVRTASSEIAVVEPDNEVVDARLRASMRNLSRMWSIDALGAQVDEILAAIEHGVDTTKAQPGSDKMERMLDEVRGAASVAVRKRYKAAELEQLVAVLLGKVYPDGRVEHWGGPSEAGADLIVYTADALGLEYKVAVQVKCFDGPIGDTGALEQIARARAIHRVDAGVVVTTATKPTQAFMDRRDVLEAELAIDIKLVVLDELVGLLLRHLGPLGSAVGTDAAGQT